MPVCLRVTGRCWWHGELSHYTMRIRETHGDGWPLQLDRACVLTWSLVVKAVVWVAPYCWLRGSDFGKPAQSRHPETEGRMSLTEYLRDTCRDGRWLEAESQTGAPPLSQKRPLPPSVPRFLCLPPFSSSLPLPLSLPQASAFTPILSLRPHPLPPKTRPLPPCVSQPSTFPLPYLPLPLPRLPLGLGKECSCVDRWKDATRTQKTKTKRTCAEHRVSLLAPRHVRS